MTAAAIILVLLTGHDSFRVREAASVSLKRMGGLALSAIMVGENSSDPETRCRCKKLADDWFRANAVRLASEVEPGAGWPWLDGTTYSPGYPLTQDGLAHYLGIARTTHCYDGPLWPASSEATRLLVIDLIANRQPWQMIVGRLRAGHVAWCVANGQVYGVAAR